MKTHRPALILLLAFLQRIQGLGKAEALQPSRGDIVTNTNITHSSTHTTAQAQDSQELYKDIDAWAIGISIVVFVAVVLIIVALVVGWRGCIVYKTRQKKKEESWKKQVQGTAIRPNPSYIEEDSSSD